ncbi:hypothetical protein ACFT5B_02205 [Luteimicrobium sp. NPDC057192]|uniref:hypothetical protein n=1 Tax=Luteimicrobium sp. NPDC057192 TaxID=3346042 RepID=UPI0036265D63
MRDLDEAVSPAGADDGPADREPGPASVVAPRVELVRFESPVTNARGRRPGVFALANGLARAGRLSSTDHAWWRSSNDWCNAAYADPSTVDAAVYDDVANPGAQAWFKSTAVELIEIARAYVALLERYGVACVERRTLAPGRVVYEDDVQVVVAPPR